MTTRPNEERATSIAAQFTGFFLAPVIFFAHLQLAYVLVPWSCARDNHLWLNVTDLLSVLLAASGAVIARRVWVREGRAAGAHESVARPSAWFIGVTGTVMGAMFVLLLLAQWSAGFLVSPCQ